MTVIKIGNKVVGTVKDGVFTKRLHSEHFLRIPPAIAFDKKTLLDAIFYGAIMVHIINVDNKRHYWATMELIFRLGKNVPDYGHGEQICLELAYWKSERPDLQPSFMGEIK
jgi:hypothetical protein